MYLRSLFNNQQYISPVSVFDQVTKLGVSVVDIVAVLLFVVTVVGAVVLFAVEAVNDAADVVDAVFVAGEDVDTVDGVVLILFIPRFVVVIDG